VTPVQLREAIQRGEWTCPNPRKLPAPPRDIPEWRQDRLKVASRCAILFIVEQRTWWECLEMLKNEGFTIRDKVTRHRINQYVQVGLEFLEGHKVFEQVYKPKKGKKN